MTAPKSSRVGAGRQASKKASPELTHVEFEARLDDAEAAVERSFRLLGLGDMQINEVRGRINAGESVESLMRDFEMYRAGGTRARAVLAVRMGMTPLNPLAVRATPTRLELGPSLRLPDHERSALAAKMGVTVREGAAAVGGAGVHSSACKLTLGMPN